MREIEWSFEIFKPPNCEVTNPSSETFVFVRDSREEEAAAAEIPMWILSLLFGFGKQTIADEAKSVVIAERQRGRKRFMCFIFFSTKKKTEGMDKTPQKGVCFIFFSAKKKKRKINKNG